MQEAKLQPRPPGELHQRTQAKCEGSVLDDALASPTVCECVAIQEPGQRFAVRYGYQHRYSGSEPSALAGKLGTARGEPGNRLPYFKDLGSDLLPLALDPKPGSAQRQLVACADWLEVIRRCTSTRAGRFSGSLRS